MIKYRLEWMAAVGIAISFVLLIGCSETFKNTSSIIKKPGQLLKSSTEMLTPRDILQSPSIIDSSRELGHLGQFRVIVSATSDIFLAGAEAGAKLQYPLEGVQDVVPDNSPVQVLMGRIRGGETLDFYANGITRHLPLPSINNSAKGSPDMKIKAGPAYKYDAVIGNIGALVGLFDNQSAPFVIGEDNLIEAPRGATSLYLGVLDHPGASSNNQGEYVVYIDVIRR
ncbi:MAG: hypothetical protein AB1656_20690 [Candidatus Omnitrophota bacterium]